MEDNNYTQMKKDLDEDIIRNSDQPTRFRKEGRKKQGDHDCRLRFFQLKPSIHSYVIVKGKRVPSSLCGKMRPVLQKYVFQQTHFLFCLFFLQPNKQTNLLALFSDRMNTAELAQRRARLKLWQEERRKELEETRKQLQIGTVEL